MEILEQHIIGKHSPETCEDGLVVNKHFAAVVDGATSKTPVCYEGMRPGRLAMRMALEAISNLPAECTMLQAARLLTQHVADYYHAHEMLPRVSAQAAERLTSSAVIYSNYRREVWMFGDCQCRFDGQTHTNEKENDRRLAQMRADILHDCLRRGASVAELQANDVGRRFILDALREQCQFQNDRADNPFSYVVIDGFPIDTTRVPVLRVPTNCHLLVMASDGFPFLYNTFAATEQALTQLLQTDPLCIDRYLATKGVLPGNTSFDDRTFLSLQLP